MIEVPLDLIPELGPLIGDKTHGSAGGGVYRHLYAANAAPTRLVPLAGPAEVDLAVNAARKALPDWKRRPVNERRNLLLRMAELLRKHADEIGLLEVIDNGTPVRAAANSAGTSADWFDYNAGWCDRIGGDVVSTWPARALDYVLREPYGVVGVIIPWNGPVVSVGMVVAPALAAGNCVVIKPPEMAPFAAQRIGRLFLEAGFPPGVVNIVTGDAVAGKALVGHPGVNKIHFTGSPATARSILAIAAENITPCGLELGGKSANVVFADADLDRAVAQAMNAIVSKSGQGCIRGTRLIVEAKVYDEVLERCVATASGIVLGDPMSKATVMGPVISEPACTRIQGMISRAVRDGAARLASGGTRLGGDLEAGYFLPPTLLADVDPGSEIAQSEVFGPVLAVMKFESDAEALELANSTAYALAAYVQTRDISRAHNFASSLVAGNIWINGFAGIPPGAPFGGSGISGYGRLGGRAGLDEFLQPKNVWIGL